MGFGVEVFGGMGGLGRKSSIFFLSFFLSFFLAEVLVGSTLRKGKRERRKDGKKNEAIANYT